jgi:hypothetical protein
MGNRYEIRTDYGRGNLEMHRGEIDGSVEVRVVDW